VLLSAALALVPSVPGSFHYLCQHCEVYGFGESCWFCGSTLLRWGLRKDLPATSVSTDDLTSTWADGPVPEPSLPRVTPAR
jgi:hypothetical protein